MAGTTFGSHQAVAHEAARVNRMHQHVSGQYLSAAGETRSYHASDPDLLLWVHLAFMDSFLRCHQMVSTRPIPGGADAYIRLWGQSVAPLGLTDVPLDEAQLLAAMASFRPQLAVTAETREVIQWLRRPPLPPAARMFYALFFQCALASLPPDYRQLIGLRAWPRAILRPLTTRLLQAIRFAIGPESPIEDAARDRRP